MQKNQEEPVLKKYNGEVEYDSIKEDLSQLKIYHFNETGPSSPFSSSYDIVKDSYSLNADGGNVAAVLYRMSIHNTKEYEYIEKITSTIVPSFNEFDLEPNEEDKVRLNWWDKHLDNLYGPNDLSDASKRYIALCVLFLQPNPPKIILIDEPDLGLHYEAFGFLSNFIQNAAKKGSQIVVTTKSPDLISEFKPSDILTVDYIEEQPFIRRLEDRPLERWLYKHTLGDLWKRRIIRAGHP